MSTRIRMQADDFFNAYLVLKDNNIVSAHPTMGVDVVCLAFSVELYIKDLHFAISGKVPRGHNILKLFEKFPEGIQQEVFAYKTISQNPFITRGTVFSAKKFTPDYSAYDGFIDHIHEISDGFEKWRYSYEKAALNYNSWFALAFIESVNSVAAAIRQRST